MYMNDDSRRGINGSGNGFDINSSAYRPMFSDPGTGPHDHHGGRPPMYSPHTYSDPLIKSPVDDDFSFRRNSASAATSPGCYNNSADNSPCTLSPWQRHHHHPQQENTQLDSSVSVPKSNTGLVGSLVREEGHIYSLAAVGDLLYTGSDSKNIRVWKDQEEYSGFKSASGLVKSIVIADDLRIFTGHQDGKVRVWKVSTKDVRIHKRVGTMPRLKDLFKSSMKPANYIARQNRHGSGVWIKHSDAVSCLCLNEDQTLLYSGSWDRTFKVWRLEDLRCIESVHAHDDAVNAVVAAPGLGGLVFTGSADGTIKIWRQEQSGLVAKPKGKGFNRHVAVSTLLKQEMAVTALVYNELAGVLYGGSSDGCVSWWDKDGLINGGGTGGVLRGHNSSVLCLASAGNLVFSGSADNSICVWRRDGNGGHDCMNVLNGHAGPVKCLAVGMAETKGMWVLYSGSLDKSVKVWKVEDNEGESKNVGMRI